MNAFNRVVAVIVLLAAIVGCTLTLIMPVQVLDAIARQADTLADLINRLQWYVRWPLAILAAVILDVFLLMMIVLEVRRPSKKAIRVEKTSGGEVLISVTSIADRLQYEIDQLPDILRTRSRLSGKRGGVVVELDVETASGADVPGQAGHIVDVAQRVVEEDMGLKLARPPKVNMRVVTPKKAPKMKQPIERKERKPQREPAVPPAPPAPTPPPVSVSPPPEPEPEPEPEPPAPGEMGAIEDLWRSSDED